jgi:hypothetical protein
MKYKVRRAESSVAALLTLAAVWLHVVNARFAGALWRDEVNTVGLVTLPGLADVWQNLQYDSFPLVWVIILRQIVGVVGPMNDAAFRIAGLIIGLAIVAALWVNARSFGGRYPLVSLALFALSPSVIRWGDSLRGYGLGIAGTILTCATLWIFITRPSWRTYLACLASGLFSVHTLYYNAAALFAFGCGAISVCMLNKAWWKAAAVAGVGIISAASLLPYTVVIQRASSWNSLVRIPNYDLTWFLMKLDEAISPAGVWATPLWCGVFVLALFAGLRESMKPSRLGLARRDRDAVLFALISLVFGVVALFFFLRTLSYFTSPWYYLILLTVVAVCVDIISDKLIVVASARTLRIIAIIGIGIATLSRGNDSLRTRMTNADIAADTLTTIAKRGDLVVVSPWYVGLTFGRYYRGAAEWTMLPNLGFERYHRYDLLQRAMLEEDQRVPAQGILESAEKALRSGRSVYMVGYFEVPPREGYPIYPPVRIPEDGWKSFMYQNQWASMVTEFLRKHAAARSAFVPGRGLRVSQYEHVGVTVSTGWRD